MPPVGATGRMSNRWLLVLLFVALLFCVGGAGYCVATEHYFATGAIVIIWFVPIVFLSSVMLSVILGLRKQGDGKENGEG